MRATVPVAQQGVVTLTPTRPEDAALPLATAPSGQQLRRRSDGSRGRTLSHEFASQAGSVTQVEDEEPLWLTAAGVLLAATPPAPAPLPHLA